MRQRSFPRLAFLAGAWFGLVLGMAGTASAHDASHTSFDIVTSSGDIMSPSGAFDDANNNFRVFLSSPRHIDSGSRGECRSPGNEENVNGRNVNWFAANGNWYGTTYDPASHLRNLHARGYSVYVSRNSRDEGYLDNRTTSQNWGSDVHIVTHSNAQTGGCGGTASYLYTAYNQTGNDKSLATALGTWLNPDVPSTWTQVQRTGLAELSTNATYGDAYVEIQFHTNRSAQSWLFSQYIYATADYGIAVDNHLGYP